MINLIKLQCPNCSANLEVDASLKQCFCQYCGTKLLINNENEKTIKIVNEADMARATYEYMLMKSQLESNADLAQLNAKKQMYEFEKKKAGDLSKKATACTIWTIVFAFGALLAAVGHDTPELRAILISIIQITCIWLSFILLNHNTHSSAKIAIGHLLRIAAFALIMPWLFILGTA